MPTKPTTVVGLVGIGLLGRMKADKAAVYFW